MNAAVLCIAGAATVLQSVSMAVPAPDAIAMSWIAYCWLKVAPPMWNLAYLHLSRALQTETVRAPPIREPARAPLPLLPRIIADLQKAPSKPLGHPVNALPLHRHLSHGSLYGDCPGGLQCTPLRRTTADNFPCQIQLRPRHRTPQRPRYLRYRAPHFQRSTRTSNLVLVAPQDHHRDIIRGEAASMDHTIS